MFFLMTSLKPVVSFRIGQIDHAAIEFAKLDQIVAARGVFRQIAVFRRLSAEVFITGDVWVDIREELYAFFFPLFDPAIQLRIVVAIPLPVPHHALAKGGHADTGPVLRPNTVHFLRLRCAWYPVFADKLPYRPECLA
ncbi:Uncharacterised protein [Salmonella enterica subsp. enterica]|uniref:Uncharacterized protein n=1 Tax=Salmonella enterica I TaxID=59201 RepID=A0A379X566_SALET|nr:Uncharacterised protein [Salmonella enterica subsp. enterica]